eukprot:SAG11_NODE_3915_length_2150_cov_28.941492_1_plen_53_part_10
MWSGSRWIRENTKFDTLSNQIPEFGPPKLPKETKSNAGLKPMAVYFGENFATT